MCGIAGAGDMVRLFDRKKRGFSEETLKNMLKDEVSYLSGILEKIEVERKRFFYEEEEIVIDIKIVKEILRKFKNEEKILKSRINPIHRNYLMFENILFYNPLEGTVRP